MRIGTWNVANRAFTEEHKNLLLEQDCNVWLLTEVNPKWSEGDGTKVLHFNSHFSKGVLDSQQHWAAILSVSSLEPCDDPHPTSALAIVDGVTFCSTILPWKGLEAGSPPWHGLNHSEMTANAIETLLSKLPGDNLVWGGDWNHSLIGQEYAGSNDGRKHILKAVNTLKLNVPTTGLSHRINPCHSIDHVAVPLSWKVDLAARVDATGLSDHDAYIVEATSV